MKAEYPPVVRYGPHPHGTAAGMCERCGEDPARVVEHCHQHGLVRGYACYRCNSLPDERMGDAWLARCEGCRTGRLPEPLWYASGDDFYWDYLRGPGYPYLMRRRWRDGQAPDLPEYYLTGTERS